jgi:hypothetical protein
MDAGDDVGRSKVRFELLSSFSLACKGRSDAESLASGMLAAVHRGNYRAAVAYAAGK